MASRESSLVTKCLLEIRRAGGYAVKMHGSVYTETGTPDILGCLKGRMLAIEVKTETGTEVTRIQRHRLDSWAKAGATTGAVRSVSELRLLLSTVRGCAE